MMIIIIVVALVSHRCAPSEHDHDLQIHVRFWITIFDFNSDKYLLENRSNYSIVLLSNRLIITSFWNKTLDFFPINIYSFFFVVIELITTLILYNHFKSYLFMKKNENEKQKNKQKK
ncbi:hypothetical protein DERP_005815, partial [Dermatophagoides pteronyssinus]